MTKEEMLRLLTAAYTGPGSAAEGTFAGDVLRACADGMAQLWSMEIDGLERRAFVSSAVGEWLTAVCAARGCVRKEGETDEALRARPLAALAAACEGESLITGTPRLAHKESDRAETLREEYAKVGIEIDLSTPEALEALVDKWQAEIPGAQVVPTAAKENFNIEGLFRTILSLLPEGPAFYPKDTLTDKPLRFFASEIIREKILKFYDKEIPYCCEIEIESYKEEPTIDRIAATIYVARDSQKGILIGHKGEKLKRA